MLYYMCAKIQNIFKKARFILYFIYFDVNLHTKQKKYEDKQRRICNKLAERVYVS